MTRSSVLIAEDRALRNVVLPEEVINDGCFPGPPGAPPHMQLPTALSERNVMTDKRTLGIGVISLGWMGRLHARSYRAIVERFPELGVAPRLIAAADPVDRVRQEAVDNLGFERACADYHDLLADPEVEAVSICAPNFLHHEMALAAVEAGKPFWIEKLLCYYPFGDIKRLF